MLRTGLVNQYSGDRKAVVLCADMQSILPQSTHQGNWVQTVSVDQRLAQCGVSVFHRCKKYVCHTFGHTTTSARLVHDTAAFLHLVQRYASNEYAANGSAYSDLWHRGMTVYRAHKAEIDICERELANGFVVPSELVLHTVYIVLLKTVLRTMRDAQSAVNAQEILVQKECVWRSFSNVGVPLHALSSAADEVRCLYLATLLQVVRSKKSAQPQELGRLQRVLRGASDCRCSEDDCRCNDLLEELRHALPDIMCSEVVHDSYSRTFHQVSTTHPAFLDYDEFASAAVRYVNNLLVIDVEDVLGQPGWVVWEKFMVVDRFRGVADELRIGLAVLQFIRQFARVLFARRKASIVDCYADDFGSTDYTVREARMVPECDQTAASNLDLLFPYYPLEQMDWPKVYSQLERNLFGFQVKKLNLAAVRFLCDSGNWDTMTPKDFRAEFCRLSRLKNTDTNPRIQVDTRKRRKRLRVLL